MPNPETNYLKALYQSFPNLLFIGLMAFLSLVVHPALLFLLLAGELSLLMLGQTAAVQRMLRAPRHRHTGEVHAFNLEGSRELCTGELIGPGDYVYEPAGNTDSWKAVGDVPLVVMVVVNGAVEYLGADDSVTDRFTAERLFEIYREYCVANKVEPLDIID